jgi:cytochrome c-type biogenesis protein CcmF
VTPDLLNSGGTTLAAFGTALVHLILVAAAYTFALALRSGPVRPHLLRAARLAAYGTSALVGVAVLLLAYAFVTHDFSIVYVSRHSNRTTEVQYLFTALWGGQDGSLLWWLLLTIGYVVGFLVWSRRRYLALQPGVIATSMVVVAFFAILMIFAANPFQTHVTGMRPEGDGLNPALRNYWMIIHPPALYLGFTGCVIPFAFAVSALATGRLDSEWIVAVRKWMLVAWLFLTLGNVLGMLWSYEELGWGGVWAWDPVENAAFLPWLTASAYVHSTMIQERRGMLKVWNVVLISLTFFLTILGTFLTRSGVVSSVHSFAQSEIGTYFVWFMGLIVATMLGLIVWRLPQLRAPAQIESIASREAMFLVNNWALLGAMTFIVTFTLFPAISEAISGKPITFAAPFFNTWMPPIGLLVYALMGIAPLFGWRKTSRSALIRGFRFPLGAFAITAILHAALGHHFGMPAFVPGKTPFGGPIGELVGTVFNAFPLITVALSAFNLTVIIQEFARGVAARRAAAQERQEPESIPVALVRLVDKSRRRYGGYIVHLGIVCTFLGFVGHAWHIDHEVHLKPGDSYAIGNYSVTYTDVRMCPGSPKCSPEHQADTEKRMIFADLKVQTQGRDLGVASPAQFIYTSPDMRTTEVALDRGVFEDLYFALITVNPQTKLATFQLHVKQLVSWIWIGTLFMIFGAAVSLWPELDRDELSAWLWMRVAVASITTASLGLVFAVIPTAAYANTGLVRPPVALAAVSSVSADSSPGKASSEVASPAADSPLQPAAQ